jgi:ferredoxin
MPDSTGYASIAVDRTACMGSGTCIMYAPGTFTHDDETKGLIIDAAGDPIESIRTAVEGCPTGALRLVEGV